MAEPAASLRQAVPRVEPVGVSGSAGPREAASAPRPVALRSLPRVRLFVPSRSWGGRRRREILLAAGAVAVVLHVALVGFIVEAPHLWPSPPPQPPPGQPAAAPTIDMVMDDSKYAGGAKQTPPATPAPPAPQTPPAPEDQRTAAAPPAPPDATAPAELPPPPKAPPPPAPRQPETPEVALDPNDSGLGYGHQDDAIPASPDDRHANKVPAYPRAAGMRGEEGTVEMLVTIGAGGQVASAEIAVSSGHPDLDRTARRAVLGWHFHPAMRDGVAVPTQSMQVFNFHIDR